MIIWLGLELFLVVATFATGITWLLDTVFLRRGRREAKPVARSEPIMVEYARSFFPVLLVVLLLRSFVVEPFRIPSGSMMPTLLVGDFILVNKFHYGLRLPVINTQITEGEAPARGDVVVFRYPENPEVNYIKRIIGLPGDRVEYRGKVLYINGEAQPQTMLGLYGLHGGNAISLKEETLNGVSHQILIEHGRIFDDDVYTVPEGHYFVMGDNRDNSNDSRRWGSVPADHLVGKAFFIWLNWDFANGQRDFSRIGNTIN
ncbi:MAG TPA: signal peptidase I [Thioalkalivibrio sp.]|nr:signal peptidase I [Thioalkalivibrio sp.]